MSGARGRGRRQSASEERILLEVDHSQGEVPAGPPVGAGVAQFAGAERRPLDGGPCDPVSAEGDGRRVNGRRPHDVTVERPIAARWRNTLPW